MEIIKGTWHVLILSATVGFLGILTAATFKLGQSSINLYEKGFFSLSKFNHALVGGSELDKKK